MIARAEALAVYKRCIAETAKRLEPLGYRGGGEILRKLADGNAAVVQFQKEERGRPGKPKFAVNLGVICGRLLQDWQPELAKADVWHAHLRTRVGETSVINGEVSWTPKEREVWWTIDDGVDNTELASEVADAVTMLGVPLLERYLSTANLISLWRGGQAPGLTEVQRERYLAELEGGVA